MLNFCIDCTYRDSTGVNRGKPALRIWPRWTPVCPVHPGAAPVTDGTATVLKMLEIGMNRGGIGVNRDGTGVNWGKLGSTVTKFFKLVCPGGVPVHMVESRFTPVPPRLPTVCAGSSRCYHGLSRCRPGLPWFLTYLTVCPGSPRLY